MKDWTMVPLLMAAALVMASCGETGGGAPRSTAERNQITDDFVSTGPLVSGEIPAAHGATYP